MLAVYAFDMEVRLDVPHVCVLGTKRAIIELIGEIFEVEVVNNGNKPRNP